MKRGRAKVNANIAIFRLNFSWYQETRRFRPTQNKKDAKLFPRLGERTCAFSNKKYVQKYLTKKDK